MLENNWKHVVCTHNVSICIRSSSGFSHTVLEKSQILICLKLRIKLHECETWWIGSPRPSDWYEWEKLWWTQQSKQSSSHRKETSISWLIITTKLLLSGWQTNPWQLWASMEYCPGKFGLVDCNFGSAVSILLLYSNHYFF